MTSLALGVVTVDRTVFTIGLDAGLTLELDVQMEAILTGQALCIALTGSTICGAGYAVVGHLVLPSTCGTGLDASTVL